MPDCHCGLQSEVADETVRQPVLLVSDADEVYISY